VAEGAKWDDGSPIHAQKDELVDFDHPRFGGAASEVADKLKKGLQGCFNTRNINAVNPSYLYRSGAPNAVDRRAAVVLGKRAVQLLARRTGEPVFLSIQIKAREFSVIPTPLCDFSSIEDLHRFVDRGFYDPDELSLTDSGRFYFEGFMADRPVPKRYRVDEKGDLPWNS